jgi:Raf kinase inhibitor-like YbhB/YbcL family protein
MRLSSTAFSDGAAIPRRYTCDGEDVSPPLRWSDTPREAQSFVLLCDDPDAPAGTWRHWAVYNIPNTETGLPEGAGFASARRGFRQAINDFGRPDYGGPCPPRGHGTHRYRFHLFAISRGELELGQRPTFMEVEKEARKYALAEATLTGLYRR